MAVISDYIGTMTFLHCNPRHHSEYGWAGH